MDFAALTAAVGAGLAEVRACLLLSRDGLALGSYPPSEEHGAMQRWMRLASLGDVERGFAVVGEECWVFCRRGPYSALVVAKASARPGPILERLDQMVLAAEESRLRKDAIGDPASRDPNMARRRRPSSPPIGVHPGASPQWPHPSERTDASLAAIRTTAEAADEAAAAGAPEGNPGTSGASDGRGDVPAAQPVAGDDPARQEPRDERLPGGRTMWVMDADDLTREFAGLLEDPERPDGR